MRNDDLTPDDSIDLDLLIQTFRAEAGDDVMALEAGLLQLETAPQQVESARELLRLAHTLKGNASIVGFQALTDLAHVYEELLERIHDRSVAVDATLVSLLLSGIDAMRRLVWDGAEGSLAPHERELMENISRCAAGTPASELVSMVAPAAERTANGGERSVRVPSAKLDRMLNLAGEIAIARGRVHLMLSKRSAEDIEGAIEMERQIDQLQGELQDLIMRARMVPVGPMFRQYARIVRDAAASHGKNARLITIGEDVEIDTSAVELLRDPLTHMIRNAIDHGIELSSVRASAGKTPVGHITLAARHEAGSIVIRVTDDGAGLDRAAIIARASKLGLGGEAFLRSLPDHELFRLIFEPGFSTADAVSDLSGRGVGMDVVRRAIESLRGTIAIESIEGAGTTFVIRLPLTLAVIDGFGVSVGNETYVVPMENVHECGELPPGEPRDKAHGVLLLRDELVPYVRLRSLFGIEGKLPARENVLVIQNDGARAGLVVDSFHGAGPAVIKPLGTFFSEIAGVAGSSILGNGRVALILDTPAILKNLAAKAAEHAGSES
jgi:two-component system chemotaxis sensor kinase CheA